MTNTDLVLIYKKFEEIDRQLKELKREVMQIKDIFNQPFKPLVVLLDGNIDYLDDKPVRWPNEPYTDYLKRIGEYNEAQHFEDDLK